jgi:hypothetical protein
MSKHEIGDRVGAILSANSTEVHLFGYGVYQGDEVPPEGTGGMGALLREAGVKNPKILLDSGEVVWGCECWWGAEQKIVDCIKGRAVVIVNPKDARCNSADVGVKL